MENKTDSKLKCIHHVCMSCGQELLDSAEDIDETPEEIEAFRIKINDFWGIDADTAYAKALIKWVKGVMSGREVK